MFLGYVQFLKLSTGAFDPLVLGILLAPQMIEIISGSEPALMGEVRLHVLGPTIDPNHIGGWCGCISPVFFTLVGIKPTLIGTIGWYSDTYSTGRCSFL